MVDVRVTEVTVVAVAVVVVVVVVAVTEVDLDVVVEAVEVVEVVVVIEPNGTHAFADASYSQKAINAQIDLTKPLQGSPAVPEAGVVPGVMVSGTTVVSTTEVTGPTPVAVVVVVVSVV